MPHFSWNRRWLSSWQVVPVDLVGVEGRVRIMVDERAVGHEQAQSLRSKLHAQVVVLVPADQVPLVEPADRPEGVGPHGHAESHQGGRTHSFGRCATLQAWRTALTEAGSWFRYGTSSISCAPETLFDRGPTAPTWGSTKGDSSSSSHPSSTRVSLFEKDNDVAARLRGPLIAPWCKSSIHRIAHHFNPWVRGQFCPGAVNRPVVNHHHLVSRPEGRPQGLQTRTRVFPRVPRQNDHCRHWLCPLSTHATYNGPEVS